MYLALFPGLIRAFPRTRRRLALDVRPLLRTPEQSPSTSLPFRGNWLIPGGGGPGSQWPVRCVWSGFKGPRRWRWNTRSFHVIFHTVVSQLPTLEGNVPTREQNAFIPPVSSTSLNLLFGSQTPAIMYTHTHTSHVYIVYKYLHYMKTFHLKLLKVTCTSIYI